MIFESILTLQEYIAPEDRMKLYVMTSPTYNNFEEHCKIGISKDPHKRLKDCKQHYDYLLKIVAIYEIDNAREVEAAVKKQFKHKRSQPDKTEWFDTLRGEVLKFIASEFGLKP